MTSHLITLVPLALMLSLPAAAAETISRETPPADACTKTVSAMGAAMSHKPDVAQDGRPIYRFLLRQNGLDYDVVCDAASGLVSDVTPRTTH